MLQSPVLGGESQLWVSEWPFQRYQCYLRVHGPFKISHPKETSRVYFLHLSALWETLFSPEVWHFLILACFPGQQPCSPALPAIQQRRVKCCHCLCACLPSCWVCLLHGQLEAQPGSQLLWQQLHTHSGHALPLRYLPKHLKAITSTHPAGPRYWQGEWFKGQENQAWPGLVTEPCRLHPFTSLAIPVPCPWPCLACLLCTTTSALLEIAAPAAEFKAGQSNTIKEKDQHGARQHSLQKIDTGAMSTQTSACLIWGTAALGLTALSKLQKTVFGPKLMVVSTVTISPDKPHCVNPSNSALL